MQQLKGLGPVIVLALGALSFFEPARGAWAFAAADVAFVALLWQRVRAASPQGLIEAAKEPLDSDEADLVRRYAYYFSHREAARELASVLAALGLASVILVPWLTYKAQFVQAVAIGACLFGVGRLTKLLSPVYALRLAVGKGDRDALRLLSAHDPALRKLAG